MNNKKKISSSFHGIIEEIPGISADNFENAESMRCRAYFLSHYHTDHIVGLHSEELIETLEKTNASIYMSAPTAAIIDTQIGNDKRLMRYIQVLRLGTTTITLPSDEGRNLDEMYLTVTVIPASHSFGSVMFLFRTYDCTVLYTGDFRMQRSDVSKMQPFHDRNGDPIKIHAMYVDTTFLNHTNMKNYSQFPKRSESTKIALDYIERWLLKDKMNRVAIITSGNYICEFFFMELYKKLKIKTYVNEEKWKFYSKVQDLAPGITNNVKESRSHLCFMFNKNHAKCALDDSDSFKYLRVHLSATVWDDHDTTDEDPVSWHSSNQLNICFATHCSREEVIYFVKYFSPSKVEGFPLKYNEMD